MPMPRKSGSSPTSPTRPRGSSRHGRYTKSFTFDVKTLESLRGEKGPDEGKVFNLVRGLQQEMDENADTAPVLQPLKERAERILKDLEDRKTTGIAALDQLAK